MACDVLIAGVGGQGTVLASRLLAAAAMEAGFFIRTAETIGMSQRGGSVVSHVRIDSRDKSPLIPLGGADLLLGFELAETARSLDRLSPQGILVASRQTVRPVTVSLGGAPYDEDRIASHIQSRFPAGIFIDGYRLALEAGSVKAANVVLLGAATACGLLPFGMETMERAMIVHVPEKYRELNIKALRAGYEAYGQI